MLAVMTLVVLEDLESKGIKHLLYCDDGLFYSDEEHDFAKIAQEKLDEHGIGAHFNLSKTGVVKANGEWKTKLKLVGLEYDPWADSLCASTRNGATLEMKVGTIGIFTDDGKYKKKLMNIRMIKEDSHND